MKKIKHLIEYFFVIILLPLFSIIPYRLRTRAGGVMGVLIFYLYRKRRNVALENISKSFPEKNKNWHWKLCRLSFKNLGISSMEFLQLPRMNENFIDKYFEVEGEQFFKMALENRRGLIAICPHLGNWEFVAAYFGIKGYPLSVIMKRQSNPYVNRIIAKYRKAMNLELIYKNKAGFAVLRGLKRNRIIGFVADQDAGKNGIFIDYFGRPASTAQGPSRFALAYQTPACVVIGVRKAGGRFKIIVSPFLDFSYNRNSQAEAIYCNTALWVGKTEEFIREYPEQYFWVHRRWKTAKE